MKLAFDLATLWEAIAEKVTSEVKDGVGRLYMREVLQLTDEEIEAFLREEQNIWGIVGLKQNTFHGDTPVKGFWAMVRELAPELVSGEANERFLSDKGGVPGVLKLAWTLQHESRNGNLSWVLILLKRNAIAYK